MEIKRNTLLDKNQAAIVEHGLGPLMVNAGPGTGKTRCLTQRFAWLVDTGLVAPSDILAVTFTREAAGVMSQRVQEILGQDVDGLRISTIHSLAYNILRMGGKKGIRVVPPEEAYEHFRRASIEVGLSQQYWNNEELFRTVMKLKERLVDAERYRPTPGSVFQESIQRVYLRYQDLLAEKGVYDFGDLVVEAVRRLRTNTDLTTYLQALTPFAMVDEFQDTSLAQLELVRWLAGAHQNIMVVGSPAQAIHGWRGAHFPDLKESFQQGFPQTREVTLDHNHRSTATIVQAATAVGREYPDAAQVPTREKGEPILIWRPANQVEEAGQVATAIQRWLDEGIPPEEIGVLYRTHSQADAIEGHLAAMGIPYQMSAGKERLYDRPEVQTLLAYLGVSVDPTSGGLLEQIVNTPPRGLGPNTLARIRGTGPLTIDALRAAARGRIDLPPRATEAAARLVGQIDLLSHKAQTLPPQEMVEEILGVTGYLEWAEGLLDGYRRLQALGQVAQDAARFDNLDAFLAYAGGRIRSIPASGVHLSTIHAAKGREWKAVIVVGVVEGLLPHATALKRDGTADSQEELRLFYVAITRPRDLLVLSVPRALVNKTGAREVAPSRYLQRLPRELLVIEK